ncbi:TIGR01777 family protein [bacterium]|nr:TIGR01777 family protein [bacterium]
MKVVIFGGTGFIGKKLVESLNSKGHEVTVSDVRRDASFGSKIKESDAVINLGGFPLFKKRWSTDVMAAIHDSRVSSTRQIVDAMSEAKVSGQVPKVFLNASAIGFYGVGGFDQSFNEDSPPSTDFLARVCLAWEDEAFRAQRELDLRTVVIRIGVVLGEGGGALEKLLPVFKLMQGSLIGTGEQPFSWVHVDDVVGLFVHALENESVKGPVNAVAPKVVSNAGFSHKLGEALSRPQLGLLGPEFFQKAFGRFVKVMLYVGVGGAAEVIANGQNVSSKKATDSGYTFHYSKIENALKDIVS